MKCKVISILLNMCVLNYGFFENAQTMLDMLSIVFHFEINVLTFALMNTDKVRLGTFFMDDYLFCKSAMIFFHSALVLPHFCLDITLKVLRSKNGKTIRLDIAQVSFSKEFFKHVKHFTASLVQNSISWLVP